MSGQRKGTPRKPPELQTPPDLEAWEKWRDKPLSTRMDHVARVLERVAALGSEDAAKSWLAHARWKMEFKNGRAPQRRADGGSDGLSITIVDDITGRRAVRIEGRTQDVVQLPARQAAIEEKDEEEGKVR